MMAVSAMSGGAQFFFFLIALVVFLVSAVMFALPKAYAQMLVAIGLAAAIVPFMWNALAQS